MARQTFHEPLIEEQQHATPLRGFQVQIGGVYILMDDVVTALREYAQSLESPAAGAAVHEAATWLASGDRELPEAPAVQAEAVAPDVFDPTPNVDRVEVYPDDPLALRPKWVSRACDSVGRILQVTNGSFDQEYVIRNAEERWPGKTVHLLTESGQDSVWEETDPGGIRSAHSGRRRPSPQRMYA